MEDIESETLFLIEQADNKRKAIKKAYEEEKEDINPLVIIQFPDMSDRLIEYVEESLETLGYTYKNGLVAKWLSDEKINTNDLTGNNAESYFYWMGLPKSKDTCKT